VEISKQQFEQLANKHPLVSVVVIFLNEQRFLQEAIDSVIGQSSPHWELLLVNDGSTDRSPEIARSSAALDPKRIRYLEHPGGSNRGKSTSRNLGLQAASGEFVTFLDGDDIFRPEKIACQATLLANSSAAMVYGPTLYWTRWPGAPSKTRPDELSELGVLPDRLYQPPYLLTKFLRRPGIVPCICGLTVRRDVAREVGGFDEGIQDLYEDQVFLAKICAQFPVLVESGCWDQYRQHPNSTSHLAIASGQYDPVVPNPSRLKFLLWLQSFLAEKGLTDLTLNRALRRAFFPFRFPRMHRFLMQVQSGSDLVNCKVRRLVKRSLGLQKIR
jgi:glycosyltransferase involved in cell wall biosynthesis